MNRSCDPCESKSTGRPTGLGLLKVRLVTASTKLPADPIDGSPFLDGGLLTGNVNSIWPHCDGLKWPHPLARCSNSRRTATAVSDGLI